MYIFFIIIFDCINKFTAVSYFIYLEACLGLLAIESNVHKVIWHLLPEIDLLIAFYFSCGSAVSFLVTRAFKCSVTICDRHIGKEYVNQLYFIS